MFKRAYSKSYEKIIRKQDLKGKNKEVPANFMSTKWLKISKEVKRALTGKVFSCQGLKRTKD